MTRRTVLLRVFMAILACLFAFCPLSVCLSGCQLSPAPSSTADTTAPPETTVPPTTQAAPEFTLDSMCAILDEAHDYYFSHDTFTLPITPYTQYYADGLINRFDAQIEYDDQHIRFTKEDTIEGWLIYLIFLNTMLTEYADQIGWVTRGRDVEPGPDAFYDLDYLVFFPECQKAGYKDINEYVSEWPPKQNATPYPCFSICFSRISVAAKVDGKDYKYFRAAEGENEAPYYDGTWIERYV